MTMSVAAWMCVNFAASVGVIWANKYVFIGGGVSSCQLTILHFVFTFIALLATTKAAAKPLTVFQVVPISVFFCGFVLFNNLSLQRNSVGTYQLLKVMTTPCIAAIQHWVYDLRVVRGKALMLICVGVVLATVSARPDGRGLWWGLAGVLATSIYQIWVKTEQIRLACSSEELLLHQAPLGAAFLLLGSIASQGEEVTAPDGYLENKFLWVIVSGVFAVFVNLSTFHIIGKTSPITYNVLGHAKLCVILLSGYLLFGEAWSVSNLLGVGVALLGIAWYTF